MNQEKEFLKIAKLIASELSGEINDEDHQYLHNWLNESEQNRGIYNEIKKDGWYASNIKSIQEYKIKEGWNKINPRIHSISKTKIRKLPPNIWRYAAAAIFVGILATGYFFREHFFESPSEITPIIVNSNIEPGTSKAILTLEDGSVVELEKGNAFKTKSANSNGDQIIYKTGKQNSAKIVYNYLTIPRGGQFHVVLSDGTEVWLNSESQLKYPVAFTEGKAREVELVYGEAYFDVSSSSNHKGSIFKVFNQSQEVEVLGTEFNIKAYKDESNVYTTLVEGSVAVGTSVLRQSLVPNQQSNLDIKTNSITVKEVDVKAETSWKNGTFSFIDKPLKDIMKVVSRWYDVDVIFVNKELEKVEFIGILDKQQSIDEVLSIIKSTSMNDYEIKDKTIILK
ncbi:FecR family protein [Flavivirga spongiicola]|uniref:DUF4974 domain-containing protein n=1 Tax=Flavivirga spongiicola TaxID=421621 RepID=A0ABU7XLU9_9FLAO|nr:FecR family protein [Flavivirga sp. MEBiC05379]MDO5981387.1 DUF4974 domain-containing protein [Flavivirga sp. MEBiC05379]